MLKKDQQFAHPCRLKDVLAIAFLSMAAAPALAVVGGTIDDTDHPYVGAIDSTAHGAPVYTSGVLISPTVFLTAGHVTRRFDDAGLTEARVTFDPAVSESSTWHTGTVHTSPAYDPQSADDPQDLGVIVFAAPITGITPALLPTADLLGSMSQKRLQATNFGVVGYGVSEMLGGANGGGTPHPDLESDGTRRAADQAFDSLNKAWVRLKMHEDGAICAGDSGSPSLLDDTDVVGSITIGGPAGCKNVNWAMRIDTPQARAFLGTYVTLP